MALGACALQLFERERDGVDNMGRTGYRRGTPESIDDDDRNGNRLVRNEFATIGLSGCQDTLPSSP